MARTSVVAGIASTRELAQPPPSLGPAGQQIQPKPTEGWRPALLGGVCPSPSKTPVRAAGSVAEPVASRDVRLAVRPSRSRDGYPVAGGARSPSVPDVAERAITIWSAARLKQGSTAYRALGTDTVT